MHLVKLLYIFMFFGSVIYFILYGIVMKKLPVIMISYQQDLREISREISVHDKLSGSKMNSGSENKESEETKNPSTTKDTVFTTRKPRISNEDVEEEHSDDIRLKMNSFLFNFKSKKNNGEELSLRETEEPPLPPLTVLQIVKTRKNDLAKLMKVIDQFENKNKLSDPSLACVRLKRVGPVALERRKSFPMKQVEKELPFVSKGGSWKPSKCLATKVAIVVPYRDRQSHLAMFLRHIHRFLRWQLLDYKIYIVEQSPQYAFNRGMLMNIGFEEAIKRENYYCVIFHDVDLLPEDDRNDYSCPSSPRHMSTAVDTMKYKLGYKKIFGGVEAFWPEHFRTVNGFPNRYWGWGGEDDDLYVRVIEEKSLGLTRPAQQIGRYTMIRHRKSTGNPERHRMLRESHNHLKQDGLNSLKYEVIRHEEFALYTLISVDIKPKNDDNSWSLFA